MFFSLTVFGSWCHGQTEYKVFRYANDSIASEGTLRNGQPDGYWKTYYENGRLKSEGNRVNFLLEGLWLFYSEEGDTTLAVNYHNGVKNGVRKVYLSDEIQEDRFANDVRVDFVRRYDRHYRLLQVIPIQDGYEHGMSPVYDTTGRLIEIINYRSRIFSKDNRAVCGKRGFNFRREIDVETVGIPVCRRIPAGETHEGVTDRQEKPLATYLD